MVLASPIFTLTSKWPWFDLELEFKVKFWNLLGFIQKPDFWQMLQGVIGYRQVFSSEFMVDFVTPTPLISYILEICHFWYTQLQASVQT